MPICRKCKKNFKGWVMIQGRHRNIYNRKYCLSCSAFGNHDTSKNKHIPELRWKKNGKCVKHSPAILGRIYRNVRRRRRRLRMMAIELLGGKCSRCGYNKCKRALEFHHRKRETKEFTIASGYNWKKIRKELKKCMLVCANCHREIEDERLGRVGDD